MLFSKPLLEYQKFRRGTVINLNESIIFYNIKESKKFNPNMEYDIFLSHSYADKDIIEELVFSLMQMKNFSFSIYIDWIEDRQLKRNNVNAKTADILKARMKNCKCLLFVTSEKYSESKWMPWELGYFDGFKNKVAILPLSLNLNPEENYKGQEYLGLYPYIGVYNNNLCVYKTTDDVPSDSFSNWLNQEYKTFISEFKGFV